MSVTLACFLIYAIVFLFGSSIGSFLNVVVYRVPLGLSVAAGRSFCPRCRKTLPPLDMVPVVSWLCLRGRCRFCRGPISPRYPGVEALGGGLAVLFAARYGLTPEAAIYFGAAAILTAVSFIDWDTMTIPNGLLLALLAPVLMAVFFLPSPALPSRLCGFFIVSLPLWLVAWLVPGAFGGGDIKLMAVCGLLLGVSGSLVAFGAALLSGGVYCVWLLAARGAGRKTQLAFGPFLCFGVLFAMLWGNQIAAWYLGLFLN